MDKRISNHPLFLALALLLALLNPACGAGIKPQVTDIKTGPTQTVDLQVPRPEALTQVELKLEFLAGDLKLSPGASEHLVSGTATYNAVEFEPKVEANGSSFTLKAGDRKIEGIPRFRGEFKNEWDMQIADTPMCLNIKTGPYNGSFELGGLSLETLTIDEVGSEVTAAFSRPNQVEMSSFTYTTGGSTIRLKGLANANFERMNFTSGAGDYTLSFDGELKRDASVTIESGAATVNLIVPEGVNARVTFNGGLTGINADRKWSRESNIYTLSGNGPILTITVEMGLGTLNLKTEENN